MQYKVSNVIAAASIFTTGALAVPASAPVTDVNANNALVTRACEFYARTVGVWQENALTRRRISNWTNGSPRIECGWWWDEDAHNKCGAIDNNIGCCYHNGVGNWVIDHNQVLGVAGDNAADCMLRQFKDKIGRYTGCADRS